VGVQLEKDCSKMDDDDEKDDETAHILYSHSTAGIYRQIRMTHLPYYNIISVQVVAGIKRCTHVKNLRGKI